MGRISWRLGNFGGQRIKTFFSLHRKETIVFIFAFLLSSLSFAAGYLTNREYSSAPIIIEKNCDNVP